MAGTVAIATGVLVVAEPERVPFRAQTSMQLTAKVVLPRRELRCHYQVRSTGQPVRMFHSAPGHDDVSSGRIDGHHKHFWPDGDRVRRAYAVDDIRPIKEGIRGMLDDFFVEESIHAPLGVEPFSTGTSLREWV